MLVDPFYDMFFVIICGFFTFMTEKDEKPVSASKIDFNQQMACRAPVCWLKYTTAMVNFGWKTTTTITARNCFSLIKLTQNDRANLTTKILEKRKKEKDRTHFFKLLLFY